MLAEPTRVRLLRLLAREELTVAELSAVTRLAQPRVSTHLAKLKELGLVQDRRAGASSYYQLVVTGLPEALRAALETLDDPQLQDDAMRMPAILQARAEAENWADRVAGDMERHYSPGRTWESYARTLVQLLTLGDVLDLASGDGVTAELLAPHCRSLTCMDLSERVVEAGRKRLAHFGTVRMLCGDMHAPVLADASFDQVLLLNALAYAHTPTQVLSEAARLLRPGGHLLVTTLAAHRHRSAVLPFGHLNQGFEPAGLRAMVETSGLQVHACENLTRERRAPYFQVLSLLASKPVSPPTAKGHPSHAA